MIVGVGIDIVRVERISEAVRKWGPRFLRRIYTPVEEAYCARFPDANLHRSGRFAAKEAVFKALGTGWRRGVRWVDVEVRNKASGQPEMFLSGRTKAEAERQGVSTIHVSIAHDTEYAVAQVVMERSEEPR